MAVFINFIPILLFVLIFFGSGVYYSFQGVENAFYQIPPTSAILPSIIIAWLMNKSDTNGTMNNFLSGARHPDIITMCIIFLLAGALSNVTKSIGSIESTVNFTLAVIPENLLLIGVFITSALISTAIGTSMGTIAALATLVTQLSLQGAFAVEIGAATLVGGAMFGDNMSVISDTTIAAVSSQHANLKEKLRLNIKIALVASFVTICVLLFADNSEIDLIKRDYSFLLITPYILLIFLETIGINNTVAIIFSGSIAKELAKKYGIKPHESAAWLDIFSCVLQGIIPYGAQILLVCAVAQVSPLDVIGKVYYCYILAFVTLAYIMFRRE